MTEFTVFSEIKTPHTHTHTLHHVPIFIKHQLKASISSLLVSALQGGENAQLPLYWSCWKRECDYDVYLSLPVYLCRRAGGLRSGKRLPIWYLCGQGGRVWNVLLQSLRSSSCRILLSCQCISPPLTASILLTDLDCFSMGVVYKIRMHIMS